MTIRTRSARLIALLACLLPAALPRDAQACWDGVSAATARVNVALEGNQQWSPEQARHWAKWIARVDALVPEGKTMTIIHGDIEICDEDGTCDEITARWDDGRAFSLFELTARIFDASGQTISSARHSVRAPLTVQVAASNDLDAAERLASRINEAELGLAGFLDIGGFPSSNDYAHVVESFAGDRSTYYVVVGAFLERSSAAAALETLQGELGLDGFVRTLDQSSISEEGC